MKTTLGGTEPEVLQSASGCLHTLWAHRFAEEIPNITIAHLRRLLVRRHRNIDALPSPEDYVFGNARTNPVKTMYAECPECREILRSVLKRRLKELRM